MRTPKDAMNRAFVKDADHNADELPDRLSAARVLVANRIGGTAEAVAAPWRQPSMKVP